MSDTPRTQPAQDKTPRAIPATGLFGRSCANPVRIVEPAQALFGRRAVEAA